MKYLKPDGEIEVGFSGCCCPPGEVRKGMHTNSCTSWWRVNDEPWVRCRRSSMHYRELDDAANSCEDFRTAAITENA